jgi:hypothetical protein
MIATLHAETSHQPDFNLIWQPLSGGAFTPFSISYSLSSHGVIVEETVDGKLFLFA